MTAAFQSTYNLKISYDAQTDNGGIEICQSFGVERKKRENLLQLHSAVDWVDLPSNLQLNPGPIIGLREA